MAEIDEARKSQRRVDAATTQSARRLFGLGST
jgi:hypothetical protein